MISTARIAARRAPDRAVIWERSPSPPKGTTSPAVAAALLLPRNEGVGPPVPEDVRRKQDGKVDEVVVSAPTTTARRLRTKVVWKIGGHDPSVRRAHIEGLREEKRKRTEEEGAMVKTMHAQAMMKLQ